MHAHLRRLQRCALHAGCGTGKTVVVATHIVESLHDRFDSARWIIVGPKPVAEDVWHREFAKWSHTRHIEPRLITFADLDMRRVTLDGAPAGLEFADRALTRAALLALPGEVHVCSYDVFGWLVKAVGSRFPYDGVVFDESAMLKGVSTERYRAAKFAVCKLDSVRFVHELTGVPMPQGYGDLMPQFFLLDKGARLGTSMTDFRARWMEPDKRDPRSGQVFSWKLRRGMLAPIQSAIGELAQSAELDIGVELVESNQYVALPPVARKAYEDMRAQLLASIEGQDVLSPNSAALVGKLQQICNGTVYDNDKVPRRVHALKIDAIREAVECEPGPVIIAYTFKPERAAIAAAFGKRVVFADQPGALNVFRAGAAKVLACHPASMSHGVDGLQGVCNTLFWFGAIHSWDQYHQLYKRLHRSGQKNGAVYVRRFLAADTLEDAIIRTCLVPKRDSNQALLDAIKPR